MKKLIFTYFFFLFIFNGLFAANVNVNHTVEKNSDKNEYKITSVFLGVSNAEFAKVSYKIPSGVTVITPYSSDNISKKESDGISFYSLSVGDEGVTTVFYIQPSIVQDISIEINFIYAVGENKMTSSIENLIIPIESTDYGFYQGVTPEDNSFVIKDLSNNPESSALSENKEKIEIAKNKDNEESKESSGNISNPDASGTSKNKKSKEVVGSIENSRFNGAYSIQLLSLSEYSDRRVMEFCIKHKLKTGDLIKRDVGNLTKVSIGSYSSKEAAVLAKKNMVSGDALLDDAFIVKLN